MKKYQKPQIISYSQDQITEIIGPAQTCTSGESVTMISGGFGQTG